MFAKDATNEDVHSTVSLPLVIGLLDGTDGTVLSCGAHAAATPSVLFETGALADAAALQEDGDAARRQAAGAAPRPGAEEELPMPSKQERAEMFKRMDNNGNGMLSLAEIDKAVLELWPQVRPLSRLGLCARTL